MDTQMHRRLQLLIELVHFRNPAYTAEAAILPPESSGQLQITIRSAYDDSTFLDFVGSTPHSNGDIAKLVEILCNQIDFKEEASVVRH